MAKGSKSEKWLDLLMQQVRDEGKPGFSVLEQSGKFKVFLRYEGKRKSKVLSLAFDKDNRDALKESLDVLYQDVIEKRIEFLDAVNKLNENLTVGSKPSEVDWNLVVRKQLDAQLKRNRKSTVETHYNHKAKLFLELINSPKIKNGGDLQEAIVKANPGCKDGSDGRYRWLLFTENVLRRGVEEHGADKCWTPLNKKRRLDLLGIQKAHKESKTPLNGEDLRDLLGQLLADGREDLWLMCGLMGIWGLRPAELAIFTLDPDKPILYVQGDRIKPRKNGKPPRPPRMVPPITGPHLLGVEHQLLEAYRSGSVKFNETVQKQIDSGSEETGWLHIARTIAQQCGIKNDRPCSSKAWQILREKSGREGCTLYSLRHSYAYRSRYEVRQDRSGWRPEIVAKWMGHDLKTHLGSYGNWYEEEQAINEALGEL